MICCSCGAAAAKRWCVPDPLAQPSIRGVHVGPHAVRRPLIHQFKRVSWGTRHLRVQGHGSGGLLACLPAELQQPQAAAAVTFAGVSSASRPDLCNANMAARHGPYPAKTIKWRTQPRICAMLAPAARKARASSEMQSSWHGQAGTMSTRTTGQALSDQAHPAACPTGAGTLSGRGQAWSDQEETAPWRAALLLVLLLRCCWCKELLVFKTRSPSGGRRPAP